MNVTRSFFVVADGCKTDERIFPATWGGGEIVLVSTERYWLRNGHNSSFDWGKEEENGRDKEDRSSFPGSGKG